jgi:hypothetical protein
LKKKLDKERKSFVLEELIALWAPQPFMKEGNTSQK